MNAQKLVGMNVRRLRVKKQISQENLATDCGLERSYVSGSELGKKNPTLKVLDRLARVLGTPLAELFRIPRPAERAPDVLPKGRKRGQP